MNKKEYSAVVLLVAVGVFGGLFAFSFVPKVTPLGSYGWNVDVVSSGVTNSTSSINTTSTQLAALITRWLTIINPTMATLTCSMDDAGTLVGSSSVATNKGVVVGPINATTTNATIPSQVSFGECNPGMYNCFPFKGAVNCVASAVATVSVISN